jgi:S1-C subfamily serine protease
VGIGFAIPANMVRAVMDEIIRHGEVRRGYLGLSVQGLNVELAEAFGVDRQEGVVVVEVDPAGPAGAAGLEPGDVIIRVGDRPIRTVAQFHGQTAIIFAGQDVDFDLLRNGREKRVRLSIGEENLDKQPGERIDRRLKGTELQNFREEDSAGEGILVTRVDSDSEAWTFGLRPGDVIVGANRQDVRNLAELRDASRIGADQLLLRVYRSGEFGYVSIR